MSFRIMYKELEVIFDSFEDLDLFAEKVKASKAREQKPTPTKVDVSNNVPTLIQPDRPLTLDGFIKNLNAKPLSVIRALVEADKPLTDTDLRNMLKLDSNMQLAGFMTSITRASKKAGFNRDNILLKETLNDTPGERAYSYSIPNDEIKSKLAELI